MNKFISILRGINVGGNRKILMADLKTLYLKLNLNNPITYIQSGNVIFESEDGSLQNIENKISQGIKGKFGFDVPVIVRSVDDFNKVVKVNPFFTEAEDIKSFHVTFLSKTPTKADVKALEKINFGKDQFKIIGKEMHLFIKVPYHKSKLSNQMVEKQLKCSATTRNWRTVNKLIALTND